MSWPSCSYDGVDYTFNHLAPFTHIVEGLRVRVNFGAHVFCKDVEPHHDPALRFNDGKTPRTFCPERFALSKDLGPTIIAMCNGNVFKRGNKFVFKAPLPPPDPIYVIAFEMRKSKSPKYDVIIQLNSAHRRASTDWMRVAPFAEAVEAVHVGNAVNWKKK